MGEVEADVHDSHHDSLARVGLGQQEPFVGGVGVDLVDYRVHEYLARRAGLDAVDVSLQRQGSQAADGNHGDVERAVMAQRTTAVSRQDGLGIVGDADEGTDLPGVGGGQLRTEQKLMG